MQPDDFPYKYYGIPDPILLFKNAQRYTPRIRRTTVPIRSIRNITSRTSWKAFAAHFRLDYPIGTSRHRETVYIEAPKWAYGAINVLPDYYTEYARVRDTGAYQTQSPYEYWEANKTAIRASIRDPRDNVALRDELYRRFPKEVRQGKITTYLSLFDLFRPNSVLDVSAAYGDRLIAALASPYVKRYTGVDPHSRLPWGWDAILEDLGPHSGKDFEHEFTMVNKQFELDSTIIPGGEASYDMALVSQPPLIGDLYDPGSTTQARALYPTFREYVVGFLSKYIGRAARMLKMGGLLCMTLLDRVGYQITELQLLLTEVVEGGMMEYVGALFWVGDHGAVTPWFVFRRDAPEEPSIATRQLLEPYSDVLGGALVERVEDREVAAQADV